MEVSPQDRDGNEMKQVIAVSIASASPALEHVRASFLHPDEEAYLAGLSVQRRRTTYLLGRHAAKQALKALLPDVESSAIEIAAGVFGQPIVRHATAHPVDVSISHTDTEACALAFPATTPMALDIERIDERRALVMRTQILEQELALSALAGLGGATEAAVIWTAKEALSKALRCGMTCPFSVLAIGALERVGPQCVTGTFVNFAQYRFESWVNSAMALTIVLPKSSALRVDMQQALMDLGAA